MSTKDWAVHVAVNAATARTRAARSSPHRQTPEPRLSHTLARRHASHFVTPFPCALLPCSARRPLPPPTGG